MLSYYITLHFWEGPDIIAKTFLHYISPEVPVWCNESFYFQESGVGGITTPELKNL